MIIAPVLTKTIADALRPTGDPYERHAWKEMQRELRALKALVRAAEGLSPLDHDPRCGCGDCHEENQIHRALYRVRHPRRPTPSKEDPTP